MDSEAHVARIALISEHASPLGSLGGVDSGGQNVYVAQVAKYLAVRGHLVDVFTRRDDPQLPVIVEPLHRMRIINVPAGPAAVVRKEELLPWMDEFTRFVSRFCREHGRYDVVHANFFMSGMVAEQLKQELGIPFVITFHALGRVRRIHQGAADGFPNQRFDIEERLMAAADRIIAECPQDFDDQVQHYKADRDKIAIVPCGFDPLELWPIERRAARAELGLPLDERIVLHLGRLVPRKGADNVVRGFAAWRRASGDPARLYIVGGETDRPCPKATPEIGRLQAIAAEEGVAPLVHFAGRAGRSALRYWYSAADVFVTTPWYEPFGITPVEAMACGTPVIGAAVGGIKHTVDDGRTGFLVEPNSPSQLANCLRRLFERPETRVEMSAAAIERANRHFTWRGVATALEAIYLQVIEDSKRAAGFSTITTSDTPAAPPRLPVTATTSAEFERSFAP